MEWYHIIALIAFASGFMAFDFFVRGEEDDYEIEYEDWN